MATGMLMEMDGFSDRQYDRVNEVLDIRNNPPKGLIFHTAGPTNTGGWRVFDIWESKELFDQFLNQRLQAALNEVGVTGRPTRQEFYPIHNAAVLQSTLLNDLVTVGARR